jgi:Uncharacterised protein family (UPF0104).
VACRDAILQLAVASMLAATAILASSQDENGRAFGLFAVCSIVILCLTLVQPRIMELMLRGIKRISSRLNVEIPPAIPLVRLTRVVMIYAGTSALSSAGILLVGFSVSPEVADLWMEVVLIALLSSIASILAVFSPAGLGVREATLSLGV